MSLSLFVENVLFADKTDNSIQNVLVGTPQKLRTKYHYQKDRLLTNRLQLPLHINYQLPQVRFGHYRKPEIQ